MATTHRLIMQGVTHEVFVTEENGHTLVHIDGKAMAADMRQINGSLFSLLLDDRSFEVVAVEQPDSYEILIGNYIFDVGLEQPARAGGERTSNQRDAAAGDSVRSPMTGVVVEVVAAAGTTVATGQVLVIVESMKMNNELRATRDGIVETVHVRPGERVERNATLVTLRPAARV